MMGMKTKKEATAAARNLKSMMKRGRWRMHVWKAWEWWYEIQAGDVCVYPSVAEGEYTCSIEACFGISFNSLDPNVAVDKALVGAQKVADRYQAVLDRAKKAVGAERKE